MTVDRGEHHEVDTHNVQLIIQNTQSTRAHTQIMKQKNKTHRFDDIANSKEKMQNTKFDTSHIQSHKQRDLPVYESYVNPSQFLYVAGSVRHRRRHLLANVLVLFARRPLAVGAGDAYHYRDREQS